MKVIFSIFDSYLDNKGIIRINLDCQLPENSISNSFSRIPSGSTDLKCLLPCNIEKKQKVLAESVSEEKELAIIENSKRGQSFHASFLKLKKHLEMDMNLRKTQIDSLLKKCKSKFFKSIHLMFKKCFLFKIKKLPQKFITNIKINRNKTIMSHSLLQIYQAHGLLKDIDILVNDDFVNKEKQIYLKEFLNLSLTRAFETYTQSEQFLKDYESIKNKDGTKIAILFDFVSKFFIRYFTLSKGNKETNRRKSKKIIKRKSVQISNDNLN
jgi:hypothetical protein